MSTFADGYSRYLTTYFNYTYRYNAFRKYFRNSIISLTEPKFMSKTLIDSMGVFPKYPYYLNTFTHTNSIDLVKIYNSSMDNTSNLMESMVGNSELAKKELYDSIPSSLDNFLAEINFQFAYISTPTDLYDYKMIIKSFISEYLYRNFFSDLYSPFFYSVDQNEGQTAGLETKSFQYQYMLYGSLYGPISTSHNIYSKFLMYLSYVNLNFSPEYRIDQPAMLTGFQTFVNNYSTDMSIDLAGIIGKSIYDYQNVSKIMKQDLIDVISSKISDSGSGFYNSFDSFYTPIKTLNPVKFITDSIVQQLNSLISIDIITNIYDDDDIIDQDKTTLQVTNEDDSYLLFMEKIDEAQLKNYLFLCFLYKFWPIKFLNVLQLSVKEYVENLIKTPVDYMFDQETYGQVFQTFVKDVSDEEDGINLGGCINYSNLATFLETHIQPEASIVTYGSDEHATFIFTNGEAFIVCMNLESYNAVNIHDYIYSVADDRSFAAHVIDKDPVNLMLILDDGYLGESSGSITPSPPGDPDLQFTFSKSSGSVVVSYCWIFDNTAEGGAGWYAPFGRGNLDGGGNVGWIFDAIDAYRYTFYPTNYIYDISTKYEISKFACITHYLYVLEQYFKSTQYNTFIVELTEDVFTYLRDNGHIDYAFDWYKYHDVVDVYFKVYLRWKLLDQSRRCVSSDYVNTKYKFTNGSSVVICVDKYSYDSIADGNYIFSEQDTIDKALQVLSHSMIGLEYALNLSAPYTGQTTINYTISYVFSTTDEVLFNNVTNNVSDAYITLITNSTVDPTYDVDVNVPSDVNLKTYFTSYSKSSSFISSMHQFSENLILSTVTREMIYGVLSEFVV